MISYDLANQLKARGFEFKKRWLNPDGTYADSPQGYGAIHLLPDLSDLIEECGENFVSLHREFDGWYVEGMVESPMPLNLGLYSSPEEAVAHLYLYITVNKEVDKQ